jgi:hypothetical protein
MKWSIGRKTVFVRLLARESELGECKVGHEAVDMGLQEDACLETYSSTWWRYTLKIGSVQSSLWSSFRA